MMVKQFAVRLFEDGIDCYEVRPGMMATRMTASSHGKYDDLIAAGFVPARRWGELADVGRAVATLADGGLSYAMGQTDSRRRRHAAEGFLSFRAIVRAGRLGRPRPQAVAFVGRPR